MSIDEAVSPPEPAPYLGAIMDIPLSVQVVLGGTSMPVSNLMKLGRGAVIPLDHRVGQPVDIVVNGRVIARGDMTVIEGESDRLGVVPDRDRRPDPRSTDGGTPAMSTAIAAFDDHRTLSGPEKVAALLLAMGKPLASRLLKHFDPAELKIITRSAAALGAVPIVALEGLVEELASSSRAAWTSGAPRPRSRACSAACCRPTRWPRSCRTCSAPPTRPPGCACPGCPRADLAAYVGKEHPQTAALILARLTPEAAAKTLAVLPRELRNALTRRMLGLRPVSEATIKILENKLRDDLLNGAPRDASANTQGRVADILNRMEPEQAEDVLSSIAEEKPVDVAAVRSKMFSFNDVVTLPQKAKSVLFDRVSTEQITMALRGTDATFRDAVLSALGARARRLIENELNSDGGSAKEIAAARRAISTTVLQLIALGEIELAGEGA